MEYTDGVAVLTEAQIAALSPQERLALIDALWEGLEPPALPRQIETEHRRILEERLTKYDSSASDLSTLDEVCDRIRAR